MSATRQEVINLMQEAEARGDIETAKAALAKLEGMQAPKFTPEPWAKNEIPDAGINPITGNLKGLLKGASFGLDDEIQGAVAAGYGKLFGLGPSEVTGQQDSYSSLYRQGRDELRAGTQQFRDQEGALSYVPEVLGGLTTGIGGLTKATTLKGGSAIGAVEGGIAGAGYADADEFASTDTAINAGLGAGFGAVTGFTLPLAGRLAKKGGAAIADKAADLAPNLSGRAKRLAQEAAEAGVSPDEAARYTFNKGRASRDALAIRAIDQMDIPQPMVGTIKELSPSDKEAGVKMLNIIRLGKKSQAFADKNRPGKVLGDTLKKKLDYISIERKKAGAQLNALVNGKLKNAAVAVDDSLSKFAGQLDDLGVELVQTKSGRVAADFDGALRLNKSDRGPIREVLRKLNRVIENGRPTADAVHDLKKAIDNELPWDTTSNMSPEALRMLEEFRAGLNKSLQDTFPGYAEINGRLSDSIGVMNEMAKVAGRKYNPNSPNADEFLGQELRKLATNYNSRVPLLDAIENVETISRRLGMESADDVARQATLVNHMEDLFGPSASRGFRSEVQKGTREAITEAAKRGARGDHGSAVDTIIDRVSAATSNIDEEKQIETLLQLLKR